MKTSSLMNCGNKLALQKLRSNRWIRTQVIVLVFNEQGNMVAALYMGSLKLRSIANIHNRIAFICNELLCLLGVDIIHLCFYNETLPLPPSSCQGEGEGSPLVSPHYETRCCQIAETTFLVYLNCDKIDINYIECQQCQLFWWVATAFLAEDIFSS